HELEPRDHVHHQGRQADDVQDDHAAAIAGPEGVRGKDRSRWGRSGSSPTATETVATEARRQPISRGRGFHAAMVGPWLGRSLVVLLFVCLAVNLLNTPADFGILLVEGVTLGLVYGLIALGYSLVYGILELINFAHGDVFMLGSWVTFYIGVQKLGLDQ